MPGLGSLLGIDEPRGRPGDDRPHDYHTDNWDTPDDGCAPDPDDRSDRV